MDHNKHGIFESIKHLAFEDEPEDKTEAKKAEGAEIHAAAAPAIAPTAPVFPAISQPVAVSDNDQAYQRLFAKTDFESTDVAATIQKYLAPLSAIADTVMPPNVKFKTAVVQAKAQAGLTEDAILATFDSLKAALEQEHQKFEGKAQDFSAREIAARQERINQVTSQITQLQQELAQLSTELVQAQGKAARAQAQFAAAVQRRTGELEQQRAQYSALLKG